MTDKSIEDDDDDDKCPKDFTINYLSDSILDAFSKLA